MTDLARPNGPSAISQLAGRAVMPTPQGDPINHPSWYKGSGGIECWEIIEQFDLNHHLGEAVAHIVRAGRKPGVSREMDLQEAVCHLQRQLHVWRTAP